VVHECPGNPLTEYRDACYHPLFSMHPGRKYDFYFPEEEKVG
jgi:hypothetical protein